MTDYEKSILQSSVLQAKVRNCEEEGCVFPMEKDLEVLLNYKAISEDCFFQCIKVLSC